ncbi:MAG TPA: hypothetical protein VLE51_03205 [Candidatus Saccharimonadales bacterium]|nr:hypothetical protein [Candidatus Saccharimonadales bacterium]
MKYGVGALELATTRFAKNDSGATRLTGWQAIVTRALDSSASPVR